MIFYRGITWTIVILGICIAIATSESEITKDPALCSRIKCKVREDRKFKYKENVSYSYKYSVTVNTNLGRVSGFPRNESTLQLDTDILLHFESPCEGKLKFKNASLSHDPRTYNREFPDRAGSDFKANLERFALRFGFDDGKITELCPDKRDPIWALNLKKGLLSMLQNTMQRLDVDQRANELDVNGICETKYHLYEAKRTSLVVKRNKNLSNCLYGSKHFSVIRSNAYRSPLSGARGSRHPLVESRADCEMTIDRNIYEEIVCNELHRLNPLSSGSTGARTTSTATLRLIKEEKDEYNEYEETEDDGENKEKEFHRAKRTNLLYDYSKTPRTTHGELRSARDLLKTMCKLSMTTDELQERFSEMFTAFIQSARLLDYPSLSQMFVRANSICKTGKRHIIDALPFIGSNAAVNVMKDLIIKRFVDQATIDKWIVAFALIPQPNLETIKALSPLLDFHHEIPDAQFVLSYSSTIYGYCANHEGQCENIEQVTRFLSYLEEKIAKGCAPRAHSDSTIKETLEALKAIGNMGLETKNLSKLLYECVEDVGGFLPMEIRIASIEAHRRMPFCEQKRDLYFLNNYRNFTLDTEIRIASYLQAMRCPDYNTIKTIKHTLKFEEINQVGTFVYSHLMNLYSSASPTRIEIQSLLTDRDLNDKFNSDRRKFSRNYDGSFFSEEYNFGANYQGNLIFSSKSYIPRSATFNLSFELFGESVNAFEVTTRLEGFEYYAEKFFGPGGPYSNEKVSGFMSHLFRSFRSAPKEEEDYWKRVKRLPNVIDNNFGKPKISFSYKIFGNDLKFSMLNNDREIIEALKTYNPWEKFKQIVSGNEIHYENVMMFLDSTYVVPMTSGLPVRLDFAGSAACNFKMSGLLETKRISNGEIELVANIAPSMSVDVVGSMTVDAFYKSIGIKLQTNMHSSGAVKIHLDVQGIRSIKLNLGLPNKKLEVFSIGTNILLTRGNGAELQEKPLGVLIGSRRNQVSNSNAISLPYASVIKNTSCTWTSIDTLMGLKLCVDYQLSNVTKDPDAPYFILSGPTLFKISLIKADPTAQSYLLEYKWDKKKKDENILRVAFDTPGSQVNREISATITFHTKSHNVTALLRSAGNSLVAEGTYRSTENETFVDIGFDINGTKHLDASFGYATKRFHYGYTFNPQMHIIVNNERIVFLSGSIRHASKNNVSQCDIDLIFRTKKVWSKLIGHIVRRNTSLAGNFQLDYQLQKMPKKETLQFEISSSNRLSKDLTHKAINFKLQSTAYPQLNTVISAWYQQALGYLELHAEVNSNPHLMDDNHKLTAQLIVSYSKMYFRNQDTKVSVLFAVTKPIQNLDIKVGVKHYATGPESKTSLLIGYAPGKEITLTVHLLIPRGIAFTMEGHANLTVPNFNSLLLDVRITEISRRTYDLDFSGTWFSGHNITARGTYADRSVATVVSHSLKLILKSPSFANDILVNCKLYRNYSDIRVSLRVDQSNRDNYAFVLNHTVASPTNFVSYVEGKYRGNVYSVTTDVDTKREIRMELHLDNWRDVHLVLNGLNEENKKGLAAELKWDANRDPAMKVAVVFSLLKTIGVIQGIEGGQPERNITASATLSYPGRYVVGSCLITASNCCNYVVDASIDWNQSMRLYVATKYNVDSWIKSSSLEASLVTPFENWKKTALSAKYLQERNKIKASGGAYWRDSERFLAEIDGRKEERGNITEWSANCGINSTVNSISSIALNLTHKLVDSQVADTRLLVTSNPAKVIDAWSIWYLDKETDNVFNLTGNLHLESSVTRFRKTDMKCQLQVLPDWKFLGAANLDLDKKTYTGKLIGDISRLKESSIELNVTTPLEKFSFVRGRFGLSERNKHIVAMVVSPSGSIGFEVLCQFFTTDYDFNILLSLATPLDILERSLLVAKLNNREADFRVGYNKVVAGFQGVWRYGNITDFHYSYLLFTPIEGFKENGVSAKLIVLRTEDYYLSIDTEFSVRLGDGKFGNGKLADTKLGIKVKSGPKPPPIVIAIKTPRIEGDEVSTSKEKKEEDEEEEEAEEEEVESSLYWRGDIELWSAVLEPFVGELDIDNEGGTYKIAGTLRYFQGKILLDDIFFIEDFFNFKNELNIVVPYKFVEEIACSNAFVVDLEKSTYTMQAYVNVKRNAIWTETGLLVNYAYSEGEEDDSKTHALQLNLKTPFEFIQFLDTNTSLDIDENYHKVVINIRAPNGTIDLFGSVETESEDAFDTTFIVEINTPLVKLPKSTVTAKRDFTDKEKYIKISGEIAEPISKSFSLQSDWSFSENRIKAILLFHSWIESLKNVKLELLYSNTIAINDTANLIVQLMHQVDQRYKLSGNYSGGKIDAELKTPRRNEKPVLKFHGTVNKINETIYDLQGELSNTVSEKARPVFGTFVVSQNNSLEAFEVTLRDDESDNNNVLVTLKREKYGLNFEFLGRHARGTLNANFINAFNWDVRARADIWRDTDIVQIRLTAFTNVQVNGNASLYIRAETPLSDFRNVSLTGNMLLTNNSGDIRTSGWLNEYSSFANLQWKLVYMIDMLGRVLVGYQGPSTVDRKAVDCRLFFQNPRRMFRNIDVGFDVKVDPEDWRFGANATVGFRDHENIDGVFALRLPHPDNDDHKVLVSYHGNGGIKDASYVIGYNALRAKTNYASDGSLHMGRKDIDGHIRASWGLESINNLLNVTFDGKQISSKYSLYTPKFKQQETLILLFEYDATADTDVCEINAKVYYPASTNVALADVSYESLANVNGTIEAVLSAANATRAGCQFMVITTTQQNKRYIKAFWPQNDAIVDSEYSYWSEKLDSNLHGIFRAEIPLNTRHVGQLTYGYNKKAQTTTGHSELTYNNQKIIDGRYKTTSESRAGFERDRTEISIENSYKPIGILYINQFEYSAGNEGTNYPTVEFKHVNLYQLDNRTALNITGESKIGTTHTGQDIQLKAIHSERTVQFKTNYEVLPGEFDQTSWLSLAEDAWISYFIKILNKTTEDVDNQFLTLGVSYPRRNFTLDGSYWINSTSIESQIQLDWDRETEMPRTLGAVFNWRNLSSDNDLKGVKQRAIFSLKHPKLLKEVFVKAESLKVDDKDLVNVRLVADYSDDLDKLFTLNASLRDESELPIVRKYSYRIAGKHISTKFDLDVGGFVYKRQNILFETWNSANYKRSFLTGDTGKLNARLDLSQNELLLQREHNEAVKYLNVRYEDRPYGGYRNQILINGTIIDTPDLNATGVFFADLKEKLTWMMLNYTPDAVESLRMYGRIPDARNAVFNIWRTYPEDFTISDISFYLKLNHSRLITSTLRWRPELRNDIVTGIKRTTMNAYESINEDAIYWKQYIRSETLSTISDVWDDAQEDLREFLDDCENLKELEVDFDRLKVYLNDSYNANDFYIKDIVSFGVYVIDELSLRSHIESLPNILTEIYEIMGDSGQAIRNSLLWIIDTIKNAFNKVPEVVAGILRGDTISKLAGIIDKLLEKYDKFMKDLHVSFIKYVENLWGKISQSISQQWNRFLLLIEPVFIRCIHYLETVAWKASKEIVDFLYDRRNDLISSPYFDRFTNFTQDVDKLYRDIKGNDIITNIQKYSAVVIRFLKERYFAFVPFGEELKDVADEIVSELKELQKLPSIRYALDKMEQVYDRAYYVYEYLEIRAKVESAVRFIHAKLTDISQTALQAESKYREAKTKFIFDPYEGLMCLEQKLPMSWHAFNQTPEFQEIPEFRAISDLKSYFVHSNLSFWSIYRYKEYMDPFNWLPPFRAQAMIIGAQHFITFDGRHINFPGSCTYLLARDFVGDTFTILIEFQAESDRITHKIIVLLEKDGLEINVFNDSIKLISKHESTSVNNLVLPIELENGTTYVYKAENIITVERKQNQFRLECNLKFDLCTLQLSGWYHGKTAGILGTINYEPMDDLTTSNGIVTKDVRTFVESWSLDRQTGNRCNASISTSSPKSEEISSEVLEFCDNLFINKSSEFVSCFDAIEPEEFLKMCHGTVSKSEACTIALSYIQACTFRETYLRIPDVCSTCSMVDGSETAEGEFTKLEDDKVPSSTDVVFIVEGKECNRGAKENRSIEQLLVQLNKEFKDNGLIDNRWSLVIFGADGVFDHPRSVVVDGQIFTKNAARFIEYFDRLPVGNGTKDVFEAIAYASKLVFRAGVSKTFILMPCSHCEPENQMLDYSVLHQVLLEHGITLHILMDGDFEFEKERLNKIFYGLDATKSYTKKDSRTLTGDVDLRRQAKLSKSILGYCTPLSLELNGTIFSGDKLRFDKLTSIKKFASVFSKRVALTAQPNRCQNCECTANNNGVARMECIPCIYPTPVSVDYETFNLNDSLASLQPLNFDYGQIDIED